MYIFQTDELEALNAIYDEEFIVECEAARKYVVNIHKDVRLLVCSMYTQTSDLFLRSSKWNCEACKSEPRFGGLHLILLESFRDGFLSVNNNKTVAVSLHGAHLQSSESFRACTGEAKGLPPEFVCVALDCIRLYLREHILSRGSISGM